MSANHSLEYIRMRMQVLKEEHERQSREIDDLQGWLDSFKKGDARDCSGGSVQCSGCPLLKNHAQGLQVLSDTRGLRPRRRASRDDPLQAERHHGCFAEGVERFLGDDLQMQLDSFKKGDVLLEEWGTLSSCGPLVPCFCTTMTETKWGL